MQILHASSAFKELGHPTRLSVFTLLVKAGHGGLPVGRLQESLQVPHSTLSHHIAKLTSVGLVKQERDGRVLYCIAQYTHLNALIDFLQDECCSDAVVE
ncbi:MAG: helix-turn-helix transcriptional regulator [Oceanospirillaceae bacterium]|jgi:DNA-binding transcriptional ArsR family regulator|nr:helix-turn-helix transcriptional regulator [Oceanospirillaceae bacterium]MBT4443018.1 helix-turn-helix transcriptional regulator [Oceanospirillaceae bacterium]